MFKYPLFVIKNFIIEIYESHFSSKKLIFIDYRFDIIDYYRYDIRYYIWYYIRYYIRYLMLLINDSIKKKYIFIIFKIKNFIFSWKKSHSCM